MSMYAKTDPEDTVRRLLLVRECERKYNRHIERAWIVLDHWVRLVFVFLKFKSVLRKKRNPICCSEMVELIGNYDYRDERPHAIIHCFCINAIFSHLLPHQGLREEKVDSVQPSAAEVARGPLRAGILFFVRVYERSRGDGEKRTGIAR